MAAHHTYVDLFLVHLLDHPFLFLDLVHVFPIKLSLTSMLHSDGFRNTSYKADVLIPCIYIYIYISKGYASCRRPLDEDSGLLTSRLAA